MKYRIGQRVKFISTEEFKEIKEKKYIPVSAPRQKKFEEKTGTIIRFSKKDRHGEYYKIYIDGLREKPEGYGVIEYRFKPTNIFGLKDNLFKL